VPVTHKAVAISGSRGTCTETGIYKAIAWHGEGRSAMQCFVEAQQRQQQPILCLQQGCLKSLTKEARFLQKGADNLTETALPRTK